MCLSKLDDLQLAFVITRLFDSDHDDPLPQSVKLLLYKECVGTDDSGVKPDPKREPHSDPFIRSMAYWILQDYASALCKFFTSLSRV